LGWASIFGYVLLNKKPLRRVVHKYTLKFYCLTNS